MQVVHARCCGLDVHKRTVVACVLLSREDGAVLRHLRTFSTMTPDLLALADWLDRLGVEQVALESTGVYWRPVFNILEEGRTLVLVNPQHIRRVPGRKTDVQDAEWLADLLRHGLVRPSFIPPAPVRELRELTRYRKTLVQERTSEVNRLHKVLEGANLKLAAVATDVLGLSGRGMLLALVGGEQDPDVLAELARGRLRAKLPALRHALAGRVQPHHRVLIGRLLAHIDFLEESIAEVQEEIERRLPPFAEAVELLQTLPGVGAVVAAAVVAEIGTDMSRFPSAKHLASWAGLCPGNKQSAGKRLGGRTTNGNVWLRAMLGEAAWSIARSRGSYLHAQYHRLARRRGKHKAATAVAHSLVVIIYCMLRDHRPYSDLGTDYFDQRDALLIRRHHVQRLEQLGYTVTLTPTQAA
ncbi:MAG TPA: IS110 family transposase [Chloroflexota bacterium]|jgi:transposase|nr:IS110 family transposase [Chloroflexota bacterium]